MWRLVVILLTYGRGDDGLDDLPKSGADPEDPKQDSREGDDNGGRSLLQKKKKMYKSSKTNTKRSKGTQGNEIGYLE